MWYTHCWVTETKSLVAGFFTLEVFTEPINLPTIGWADKKDFMLLLVVVCTLTGGQDTREQALRALYEATGGQGWRRHDNWLSSSSGPCTGGESFNMSNSYDVPEETGWYGVECDHATGEVVRLHLVDNALRGTVPTQIASLSRLEHFNVYGNAALSGTVTTQIGALEAYLHWVFPARCSRVRCRRSLVPSASSRC